MAMGYKDKASLRTDELLHMCIIAGCDYLVSPTGVHLQHAHKFVTRNTDEDMHRALIRLPSTINRIKSVKVDKEYRDGFMDALAVFKHQLVYCPVTRQQRPLTPRPHTITERQIQLAGKESPPTVAYQLALGNCDPSTKKQVHNFDPDKVSTAAVHRSIWSRHVVKDDSSSRSEDIQKSCRLILNAIPEDSKEKKRSQNKRTPDEGNQFFCKFGRPKVLLSRDNIQKHEDECTFSGRTTECVCPGCKKVLNNKEMKDHIQICVNRKKEGVQEPKGDIIMWIPCSQCDKSKFGYSSAGYSRGLQIVATTLSRKSRGLDFGKVKVDSMYKHCQDCAHRFDFKKADIVSTMKRTQNVEEAVKKINVLSAQSIDRDDKSFTLEEMDLFEIWTPPSPKKVQKMLEIYKR